MSRGARILPGGIVSQPTVDPLLCAPDEKAAREAENCVRQLEAIESYVLDYGVTQIRENHVLELQKLAVEGIYGCGARYRTWTNSAELEGGGATHELPEPARIAGLVREMLDVINDTSSKSALERMAYALWRVNWIHPFRGGNGRTARAIAYFVCCIDFKRVPPGKPTFPTRISNVRDAYIVALRAADASELAGEVDLGAMIELVYDAMIGQLDAAKAELDAAKAELDAKLKAAADAIDGESDDE